MVKRATKKIRGKENRKRKSIILIGSEGKNKTETKYLTSFNRYLKSYVIHFSSGNETDALGVVNNTISSISAEDINLKNGDLAFCLIDFDTINTNEHNHKIEVALKKANQKNISVLISNPIFEIWFLQHFRFSTKKYLSNKEVLNELKKYIPNYEKNLDVFPQLFDKTSIALKNAKNLKAYHKAQNNEAIQTKCPSTDVYQLIELLYEEII